MVNYVWLDRSQSPGVCFPPEGGHHLVIGEVLMVVMVDGVATGLSISPPGILVTIEPQFQVLSKGHGPRVIRKGHHRSHLQRE